MGSIRIWMCDFGHENCDDEEAIETVCEECGASYEVIGVNSDGQLDVSRLGKSDNEIFYDQKIAPELARLAQMCKEREGISFFAAVEYEPGDIGETRILSRELSFQFEMVFLALMAFGNIDRLVLNLFQAASKHTDVDLSSSIVYSMMRGKGGKGGKK